MNKYKAVKTEVNGIMFDSKAEARRYGQLLMLERAGQIRQLERQVVFVLVPAVILNGRKKPAVRYVADFKYYDFKKLNFVIEDVKGVITPLFRAKQHLMKHVHNLDILVTS